jgi:hypothetical protein
MSIRKPSTNASATPIAVLAGQPVSPARREFLDALSDLAQNQDADHQVAKQLHDKLMLQEPEVPFSPFDIETELYTTQRKSLFPTRLKSTLGNNQLKIAWPDDVYVYQDYQPGITFRTPPADRLFIDAQSSINVDTAIPQFESFSTKNGRLWAYLVSHLKERNQEVTVFKTGLYIHFDATAAKVGRFGSVCFSPRVSWDSLKRFDPFQGLSVGLEGVGKMRNFIELTVDEFVGGQFEPLTNYASRIFPLDFEHQFLAREFARFTNVGTYQTGAIEHCFLGQAGRTYRLGVHARTELVYDISKGGSPIANCARFTSAFDLNVSSITVTPNPYVK